MALKIEPYKGIAASYDEIRPSYPEKLIEDIILRTGIKPSDRLLEIGPGTGKATIQFAEKGFAIHGIESGEDMAAIMRNKCRQYEKVTLEVVPFEQWDNTDNDEYDMVFSAQTFHWLDPKIKYEKCHRLLKDNGYLVLFWYNVSDSQSAITDEIECEFNNIVARYVSDCVSDKGKPERRTHDGVSKEDERKAEIEDSKYFKLVEKIEYVEEKRNDASQFLKSKKSIPAFASMLDKLDDTIIEKMDSEIVELINSFGGYVNTRLEYSLYITRKINKVF